MDAILGVVQYFNLESIKNLLPYLTMHNDKNVVCFLLGNSLVSEF